jgi:hypothetical protein
VTAECDDKGVSVSDSDMSDTVFYNRFIAMDKKVARATEEKSRSRARNIENGSVPKAPSLLLVTTSGHSYHFRSLTSIPGTSSNLRLSGHNNLD